MVENNRENIASYTINDVLKYSALEIHKLSHRSWMKNLSTFVFNKLKYVTNQERILKISRMNERNIVDNFFQLLPGFDKFQVFNVS